MKRLLLSILTVLTAVTFTMPALATPAAAAKEIAVVIDGVKQYYDPAPVVINGRTLVPMRAIFEELGMIIEWNQKTSTVHGYTLNNDLELTLNSKWAFLNDQPIELDVPAQLVKNRTMVPIRFVGEAIGAQVAWNPATSTVTIKSASSLIEGGYMNDLMDSNEFRQSYAEVETNLYEVRELFDRPAASPNIPKDFMRKSILTKVQEVDDSYRYLKTVEAYDMDLKYLLERYDQIINVFLYTADHDDLETYDMMDQAFSEVTEMFMALSLRDYNRANHGADYGYGCDSPFCWYKGLGEAGVGDDLNDPYDPGSDWNSTPQLPQGYKCDPMWEYPGYYVDGTFVPNFSLGELCHEEYYEEVGSDVGGDYLTPDDPRLPQTPPASTSTWGIYDNTRYGFTVKNPWGEGLRATNGDGMAWSMMNPDTGLMMDIRVYARPFIPSALHNELRDHATRIRLDDGTYGNLMIEYDSYRYAYILQIQKGPIEYMFSAEAGNWFANRDHSNIMAAIKSFHIK